MTTFRSERGGEGDARVSNDVRWLGWLAVAGIAIIVIVVIVLMIPILSVAGHDEARAARVEDLTSLRVLAGSVIGRTDVANAPDGKIDVFGALRAYEADPESHALVCRSRRLHAGPTPEQVESGDYADFPWARGTARAVEETRRDGKPRPLLWEPRPDDEGWRLVAFTDGSVRVLTEEEFRALP